MFGRPSSATAGPQVPILPDNYSSAARGPADAPGHGPAAPEVSIVAADPDNVLPGAPLSAMEGISLDSVELKFVHEHAHHPGPPADSQEHSGGMIRDLWKGMVDDVLGPARKTA
ncbi:hypothetical protein CDD83_1043 [Cordyceps sp. RAO-2017]|nr:hypothetical protein CDD83_1043 [Cordyceps sp. RAO-2017]